MEKGELLAYGAQVKVYDLGPNLVRKVFNAPPIIVQWWEEKGMPLGRQPHASVPGDSLASAMHKYNGALKSVKLAFSELRERTGLVSLHLDADPPYFDQEKIELLGTRVDLCMKKGDLDKALNSLGDFLDFTVNLWRDGYTEDTFNFQDNYGYSLASGKFIMCDVGGFTKDWSRVVSEMWRKGLFSHRSYYLLLGKYPQLAVDFKALVDKKIPLNLFLETIKRIQ